MAKPLLFVVDDDPVFLTMIEKQLHAKGFKNVKSFTRGEDCIHQLSKKPKAILLDFSLEGLNGLDVLKEIKTNSPKSKVIILTALNDDTLKEKCLSEGAHDYIVKNEEGMAKLFDQVLVKIKKSSLFPF